MSYAFFDPHNSEQYVVSFTNEKAQTQSDERIFVRSQVAGGGRGFDRDSSGTRARAHS